MPRLPFFCLALLVGCIEPKTTDEGADDSSGGDDTSGSDGTTIYDIQKGDVEEGTVVTLEGVIATSGLDALGKGFFVEDPRGGEYSGIYVFLQGSFTDLVIYPNDELTITGTPTEFYDWTEFTVNAPSNIEVTGELEGGITPEALTGTETWTDTEWEPWESVLVSIADQTVESAVDNYGAVTLSAGLTMDNLFFDFDTEYGATYTGITGPLSYSYSAWTINPRDEGDLVGYTPGAGPETVSLCDLQAEQESGTWTDKPVKLEGVIATTGLKTNNEGFWVQAPGGGAWCGVQIYIGDLVTLNPEWTVSPGDELTLEGTVTEFPWDAETGVTEISVSSVDDISITSSGNDVTALALSAEEVPTDSTGWEPYEGVLLTLPDVTLSGEQSEYGQIGTNYGITLDDTLYYYDELFDGDTYATLTGVVDYAYELWVFLPRSAEDMGGETTTTDPSEMSVSDLQQGLNDGTVEDGDKIKVVDVIATSGVDPDGDGFFVQDAGGGAWSGVYVYLGGESVSVEVGDVLTITGTATDFPDPGDLSEIKVSDAADVLVTGEGTPVATLILEAPESWEEHESCLITLPGVEILSDPDSDGEVTTSWDINVDDLFFEPGLAEGDLLSSLTGPLFYDHDAFKIEPRSSDDLVE